MHILHDTIGVPKLKIDITNKNFATLTVGPLPSGYGMTLGNALRRVLLSGLPGTAVTAVKITGITHEYDTLKGVVDSVLDIILNLRALRLRKHSKEVEVIDVPFVKSGTITAKDLKVSSDIEILDPTQIITTCDGASVKTKMQLRIERGVGYRIISNEDSVAEADPEFILIDSNFSPIKRVKYEVTPARVADQTNLDQLKLEVETDGSLEAESAIKLAAGIIESYFQLFNTEDAYTDEDFTTSFSAIKAKEEAEKAASAAVEESFTPIDILGFSQRTLNALVNGGITSVEELLKTPMSQLSQLRGFGQKAKTELEEVLRERGYTSTAPAPTAETETAETTNTED